MSDEGSKSVTPDEFRDVIGHFATGVTVVTAVEGGRQFGTTASAVSSVSLEPPMLLICMNRRSSTGRAIASARRFAVNILAADQGELAKLFATRADDKFAGVATTGGAWGDPLLDDALGHVECRVAEEVSSGTHIVFIGEVERATAGGGEPLAYYRGQFGRLELARDEEAYKAVRALVIARDLSVGEPLDVDGIATRVSVPRPAAHQALARLDAEGLLERTASGEFIMPPITFDIVEDAFRARTAVQLGAAVMAVGRATADDIGELRRLMEATLPRQPDGTQKSMETWFEANQAFHEAMVRLAGSSSLLEAYRRFTVQGLMNRSLPTESGPTDDIADDHIEIVAAYERGDLEAALEAIRRDYLHALQFNLDRIRAAGGPI